MARPNEAANPEPLLVGREVRKTTTEVEGVTFWTLQQP